MTAFDLLHRGQLQDAATLWSRVSADFPKDPEVAYLEAELAMATGDAVAADRALRLARATAPGSLPLTVRHADVLERLKRRTEALETAGEAINLAADNAHALWTIGRIHQRCNDPATAAALYEQARDRLEEPALLYDLAAARFFTGDAEGAAAALDALLQRSPESGQAAYLRAVVQKPSPTSRHVDALRMSLEKDNLDDPSRAAFFYALASELEDLGEHASSFEALLEGARLKRKTLAHDPARELENIRRIIEIFDEQTLATIPEGDAGEGAVFIIGMPRTGTTLLEQLMIRHADVRSSGELTDFADILRAAAQRQLELGTAPSVADAAVEIDFAALGHVYMEHARQAAGGARRFIDKMTSNYMYCGLIAKALPKAKIVHLVRNPMDTCYSAFKTLFNDAYLYSYDQVELADYYLTYREVMHHWHQVIPGRILDVRYEALATNPDEELRRVLAWCGLDWNQDNGSGRRGHGSMTASFCQARTPVHSRAIGSWRAHAAGLAPLRQRLAEAGVATA